MVTVINYCTWVLLEEYIKDTSINFVYSCCACLLMDDIVIRTLHEGPTIKKYFHFSCKTKGVGKGGL